MNPTDKAFTVGFIYPLGRHKLSEFFSEFERISNYLDNVKSKILFFRLSFFCLGFCSSQRKIAKLSVSENWL